MVLYKFYFTYLKSTVVYQNGQNFHHAQYHAELESKSVSGIVPTHTHNMAEMTVLEI